MKSNLLCVLFSFFYSISLIGQSNCVNQETSTTFFKECVVSETEIISLNDDFGLDDNGIICTPGVILSEVPVEYSDGVINMEDLNESEDKTSLRQAMVWTMMQRKRIKLASPRMVASLLL